MLEVSGRVDGARFIVSALGREVELETVEVGADERGMFAIVLECERNLADGFKVRSELEPDERGLHGAVIDVYLEGQAREALRQQLRASGQDPDAPVVAPFERCFSVYFNSAGRVDGRSSTLRADSEKPPVN